MFWRWRLRLILNILHNAADKDARASVWISSLALEASMITWKIQWYTIELPIGQHWTSLTTIILSRGAALYKISNCLKVGIFSWQSKNCPCRWIAVYLLVEHVDTLYYHTIRMRWQRSPVDSSMYGTPDLLILSIDAGIGGWRLGLFEQLCIRVVLLLARQFLSYPGHHSIFWSSLNMWLFLHPHGCRIIRYYHFLAKKIKNQTAGKEQCGQLCANNCSVAVVRLRGGEQHVATLSLLFLKG